MFFLPDEIKTVLNKLQNAGFEAYVVGGAVRDMLSGRRVHDYDVATSARPEDVLRVFSDFKTVNTGIKHGTVTVVIGDFRIEVTAFRCESDYSDGRHPDSVSFTADIKEDLSRRDFTVNAIALDINGRLTDPYGGENDVKNRLIKCVGDPGKRFSEDHLRILRALRFSSELCFGIEENTAKKIREYKELILTVSAERVYSELRRLLEGDGASEVLSTYGDVISLILGTDNGEYYLKIVKNINALKNDATLRIAALLSNQTAEKAAAAMKKLRAKNAHTARVTNAVRYAETVPANKTELKKFISKAGYETVADVLSIRSIFDLTAAKLLDMTEEIRRSKEPVFIKDLALNGDDLIGTGASPGEQTGRLLEKLLDLVIEEPSKNERNALLCAAKAVLHKKL